jgi:hypothetical protein
MWPFFGGGSNAASDADERALRARDRENDLRELHNHPLDALLIDKLGDRSLQQLQTLCSDEGIAITPQQLRPLLRIVNLVAASVMADIHDDVSDFNATAPNFARDCNYNLGGEVADCVRVAQRELYRHLKGVYAGSDGGGVEDDDVDNGNGDATSIARPGDDDALISAATTPMTTAAAATTISPSAASASLSQTAAPLDSTRRQSQQSRQRPRRTSQPPPPPPFTAEQAAQAVDTLNALGDDAPLTTVLLLLVRVAAND